MVSNTVHLFSWFITYKLSLVLQNLCNLDGEKVIISYSHLAVVKPEGEKAFPKTTILARLELMCFGYTFSVQGACTAVSFTTES